MKAIFFPVVLLFSAILSTSAAFGSNAEDENGTQPLSKGSWLFKLSRPFELSSHSDSYDGTSYKYSDFRVNLESNYLFRDNMGIGLKLSMNRSVSDEFSKQITTRNMIAANYLQGYKLADVNMLAKASVGVGYYKYLDKSNDQKENAGLFRAMVETGPMIKLSDVQAFYFYPAIGFMYSSDNYDNDYKEKRTNLFVKANFLFNFSCEDMVSDCESDFENVHQRYVQGVNVISASTMADIKFGGLTDSYDGSDDKYATSRQSLKINYGHYVIDNLAINGWTSVKLTHEKSKDDSDNTYNTTDVLIGPGATYHPPLGKYWENIFLNADLGLGVSRTSYGGDSDYKENIFGGRLGAGYDLGLAEKVSIFSGIWYKYFRHNNPDSDEHQKFINKTISQLNEFSNRIDVKEELKLLKSQLK